MTHHVKQSVVNKSYRDDIIIIGIIGVLKLSDHALCNSIQYYSFNLPNYYIFLTMAKTSCKKVGCKNNFDGDMLYDYKPNFEPFKI